MSLVYATRTIPISLIISIFLLLGSIMAEAQVSSSGKIFKFSLAAVAQVNTNGRHKIIPVVDNMVLHSGNLIKFYLELEKEGYLYLFHEDSQGELTLFFPKNSWSKKVPASTPVYIPEGNSWIELDSNTGKENIHILVSTLRLERLEKLYNHHIMLKEKDDIKQSLESIIGEINSLKRTNFGKQAEKPLRIAGKVRGNSPGSSSIPQELSDMASEITTSGTYVKSVTINHK
jgi:hypothetical protein